MSAREDQVTPPNFDNFCQPGCPCSLCTEEPWTENEVIRYHEVYRREEQRNAIRELQERTQMIAPWIGAA